jgi:hypothetical protein
MTSSNPNLNDVSNHIYNAIITAPVIHNSKGEVVKLYFDEESRSVGFFTLIFPNDCSTLPVRYFKVKDLNKALVDKSKITLQDTNGGFCDIHLYKLEPLMVFGNNTN